MLSLEVIPILFVHAPNIPIKDLSLTLKIVETIILVLSLSSPNILLLYCMVAENVVTGKQTDRQTDTLDEPSTVTLAAHARQGLTRGHYTVKTHIAT